MRQWLIAVAEPTIVVIDALALLVIVFGTIQAFVGAARAVFSQISTEEERRDVWLRYGRWLVAGLTFQLAADIIETSITTGWEAIGRIAAIAVLRTFLNYFLERDLAEVRARRQETTKT
jgi:uncharacterized membrane protein